MGEATAGGLALILLLAERFHRDLGARPDRSRRGPWLVLPRLGEIKAYPDYHPDYRGRKTLFIRTNDEAEDYRIVATPLATPAASTGRRSSPTVPACSSSPPPC